MIGLIQLTVKADIPKAEKYKKTTVPNRTIDKSKIPPNRTKIPKIPQPKKGIKEKLPDYESKMQALTGCYFIFDKIFLAHNTEYTEFLSKNSYDEDEFYNRFRLDHIIKCLQRIGDFNVSRVNKPHKYFKTLFNLNNRY